MATIKDVAQLANVSVSTVSKYINGGTVRGPNAQAIADAIVQLGFRANPFARNLKNETSPPAAVRICWPPPVFCIFSHKKSPAEFRRGSFF